VKKRKHLNLDYSSDSDDYFTDIESSDEEYDDNNAD
jgi:hypothetical protein